MVISAVTWHMYEKHLLIEYQHLKTEIMVTQ